MSSPLTWPQPLQPGDRVRLAAASSALDDPAALERLQAGRAVLESWGLELDCRPVHGRSWGYLAGRDEERRGDLLGADREGAALIACVRGGWGSARLLERPLALPPRWLLGFSDVTSLLWAQLAQGHGGGLHGPLLTTLAAEPAWSQERLRQLLFGERPPALEGEGWRQGVAEGPLLVANLTVATHLLGTAHLPALTGAILVLEDVGEAPYRIDRMLTHWRLSGALGQLAGIAFGAFSGCDDEDEAANDDDGQEANQATAAGDAHRRLEQVLRERTLDLGIPVLAGLPLGHRCGNAAMPLGARARLDADAGRLELLDWPPGTP
jgi:muramoyltetrapeptide carboxypeptidase